MMWLCIRCTAAILLALTPLYVVFQHLTFVPHSVTSNQPKASNQSLDSALALWHQGQYQQGLTALKQIVNPTSEVAFYSAYFERYLYRETQLNNEQSSQYSEGRNCSQQLLFVTGDVYSLAQAEVFKSRFAKDQRLASLPICIQPIIWFDPGTVKCKQDQQQAGRLTCALSQLAKTLKAQTFTHLVVFADKGKANVHNGIMFLDRQDTYDVFIHELAHFSGFVDEYPLNGDLARQICNGVDAPNLVFRKANTEVVDKQYWQSIGLDLSLPLNKARTCNNHPTQAYKSEKKLTFMEYHDVAYIPKQYLVAWQKRLLEQQNSPSAHINFAQFYESQHNEQESRYWRAKYQAYLED